MSLRKKQVEERRNRILSAAEKLIRRTHGTDFTMRTLAAASEVSFATPYNLFNTKEALLYALLARQLDSIFLLGKQLKATDPVERVVEAAEAVVESFVSDPDFLRALYLFVLGFNDRALRPPYIKRARAFWRLTLDLAVAERLLTEGPEADALAYGLLEHFIGVLDLWVHEDISDEEYRLHAVQGALLHMMPFAKARQFPAMRERLRANMVALMRLR